MICLHATRLVLLLFGGTLGGQTSQQSTTQSSEKDPDVLLEGSVSRSAYYQWRSWLLDHPVVRQNVPPVPRATGQGADHTLNVSVKVTPSDVLHVDQAQQSVHLSAGLEFRWRDPALALREGQVEAWTNGQPPLLPAYVSLPSSLLWLPQVVVVEGVTVLSVLRQAHSAEVDRDGGIRVHLPCVLAFSCRFDMSGYPFDQHDCPLTVMDSARAVNVVPSGTPWDSLLSRTFGVEGEWSLLEVRERALVYPHSRRTYTQCVLRLKRKTTFYVVLMIVPMVMTSYLNVLVFLLPPEVGDKAAYLVTVLISLSFFTSFFNANMPRGITSIPGVVRLLIFVFAESFLALLVSLLMLRRYTAETQRRKTAAITQLASGAGSASFISGRSLSVTSGRLSTVAGFHSRELNPGGSRQERAPLEETNTLTCGEEVDPGGQTAPSPEREVPSVAHVARGWRLLELPARHLDVLLFTVLFVANTIAITVILAFMV